MFAIGVDVGGTWTRVAAVDPSGRVLRSHRTSTSTTADELIRSLIERINRLRSEIGGEPNGIGIALPGVLDEARRVVLRSVNLPFLQGRAIAGEIERATRGRVTLVRDADAAAWGEYSAMAPRPRRFVHLRLGTGVACGVIRAGRLQPTDPHRTTHWNVLIIDDGPTALPCPCGLRGCLETVASGPALEEAARRLSLDGLRGLHEAWENGDPGAMQVVDQAASATARAIGRIDEYLRASGTTPTDADPMVVSLGGGVIHTLPCLLERARIFCHASGPGDDGGPGVLLVESKRGDDAGVIGAVLLAIARG